MKKLIYRPMPVLGEESMAMPSEKKDRDDDGPPGDWEPAEGEEGREGWMVPKKIRGTAGGSSGGPSSSGAGGKTGDQAGEGKQRPSKGDGKTKDRSATYGRDACGNLVLDTGKTRPCVSSALVCGRTH